MQKLSLSSNDTFQVKISQICGISTNAKTHIFHQNKNTPKCLLESKPRIKTMNQQKIYEIETKKNMSCDFKIKSERRLYGHKRSDRQRRERE